ncbi:MAG: hypothetical protein IT560_05570 [Alphaproteobacteria bacterium]|jgi:hypothetical protein|nr:hypothetical protein [Alphaproteobacteria bacterium]
MSAPLSFRHKFMIVSTGVVAGALAGVFFMGPLAIYKAWFGVGAVMLLLSLASMIGRGYFSTAVIMAGIAVLADPNQVFTVEAEIAGPLILKAYNIMSALRVTATAAALLLTLAGIYHRFGRKPAAVLSAVLLAVAVIGAAGWYVVDSIAAKNAKAYEAALIGCAAEMQPAAKAAKAGIYKYISTRREAWHACAVEKTCMDAMCRLSFKGSTRFLDILRRAGDRVIVDETAVKYDGQVKNCGLKLSQLAAAETVEQYINAHPGNPQYAERIDWDLLDCMASGVCGQYEEQTGVREQTCRDAYINMHETGVLSPSLDVMRNFNGETKK